MILGNHNNIYTVETVLSGHPDKVCDQICDAILDSFIAVDKNANVTVECMGTGDNLFIGGEVFSTESLNVSKIALQTFRNIGYDSNLNVVNELHLESTQTNAPIKNGDAGDQGIMYGYACKNEYNFLPLGVFLVNAIAKAIDKIRHCTNAFLPDGKVQITLNGQAVLSLVVCVQHEPNADLVFLKNLIIDKLFQLFPILETTPKIFFNHNSNFTKGGFEIDAGLSGRKIIADTYCCGLVPHGGGSFSGKDPYRMDRAGAYMARYVAKNIVANGIADSCLVSLAYVFGHSDPVMIHVDTGNLTLNRKTLTLVKGKFDFRPPAIVECLDLYGSRFLPTATYGHFTNPDYSWEKIINI